MPDGPTQLVLLTLDNLQHSYVNLADPRDLHFWYIKSMAAVTDADGEPGSRVNALSIGGGGFTMPRYITSTCPGSTNAVLEVDPKVVEVNRKQRPHRRSCIRHSRGDARERISNSLITRRTLSWGMAFASESVPWHLTTVEFLEQVKRVMTDDGVFVFNVIDYDELEYVKAQLATLRQMFGDVVLIGQPGNGSGFAGGNFVIAASPTKLDVERIKSNELRTAQRRLYRPDLKVRHRPGGTEGDRRTTSHLVDQISRQPSSSPVRTSGREWVSNQGERHISADGFQSTVPCPGILRKAAQGSALSSRPTRDGDSASLWGFASRRRSR